MKIVDEYWDEENKEYGLTLGTNFGNFSAVAICSQEDIEDGIASKWDGMRIAYYKALLKYTKAKVSAYYQRYIGAKEAITVITDSDILYDMMDSFYSNEFLVEDKLPNMLNNSVKHMFTKYQQEKAKYQELKKNFNSYVDSLQNTRKNVRNQIERILGDKNA